MRSSPLRLRASDTARRRGHEAGTGDDVTTGLRLWVRLPSSVLPVLRGLGTGQPPAGSRAGKCKSSDSRFFFLIQDQFFAIIIDESLRECRCSSNHSELFPCQLKSEPESPSSVGVMDGSRLLLCALTFFCLSLNPLPSLLGSETSGSPNFSPGHGPSRTLVWFPNHTQDFGEHVTIKA